MRHDELATAPPAVEWDDPAGLAEWSLAEAIRDALAELGEEETRRIIIETLEDAR